MLIGKAWQAVFSAVIGGVTSSLVFDSSGGGVCISGSDLESPSIALSGVNPS